mmetsp:Transcript_81111/g.225666  ORF Transcript_81111/g.225666 Transcript_81111/m.225666 type:complete len:245 (+) Transcript_81111:879-1613(+)
MTETLLPQPFRSTTPRAQAAVGALPSTATTCLAPAWAANMDKIPVPQPISKTTFPGHSSKMARLNAAVRASSCTSSRWIPILPYSWKNTASASSCGLAGPPEASGPSAEGRRGAPGRIASEARRLPSPPRCRTTLTADDLPAPRRPRLQPRGLGTAMAAAVAVAKPSTVRWRHHRIGRPCVRAAVRGVGSGSATTPAGRGSGRPTSRSIVPTPCNEVPAPLDAIAGACLRGERSVRTKKKSSAS